jgi:hypothetical protein
VVALEKVEVILVGLMKLCFQSAVYLPTLDSQYCGPN